MLTGGLVVAVIVIGQTPSTVSVEDELRRAKNEYAYGNYEEAVRRLSDLLYPMRLYSDEQVIEAHHYLALSYYLLGDHEEAREEFTKLLLRSPDYELDPFAIAPPIIDLLEGLRRELKPQLDVIRQRRVDEQLETVPAATLREIERTVIERSEIGTLLPFGVGQFQNGDWAWGLGFAAAEALLLGINVTCYLWARQLKNETRVDGARGYRAEDADLVRALTVGQFASAALLGVTWSLGVLHARLNFVPVETLPPRIKETPLGAPAPPAAPSGAGALLTIGF